MIDDEFSIGPGVRRRLDLGDRFVERNDILSSKISAPFWPNLIFDHHARETSFLKGAHGVIYIDGIAIAFIDIRLQWDRRDIGQRPGSRKIILEVHDPHFGKPQCAHADARTRDECRLSQVS